jgi:uncharacterized protein YjiS (DUF1127 family)
MCAGNESSFDFKSLTSDQWQRTRQQIIRRADAARAQALRDLGNAVLRGLQTAAWAGAAAAGKWWRAYAAWRERIAAVRELRALDDRTLKDIGVNRSEIESVVGGQDTTRLRDATIAANRARPRYPTAGAGTTHALDPQKRRLVKSQVAAHRSCRDLGALPLSPPELGLARVRHFRLAEVG